MALVAVHVPNAQAAPPVSPLTDVTTGTLRIVHTADTTHEMSVFANGRITNQYFAEQTYRNNQINTATAHNAVSHTTIAVMFDQHTSGSVDVGSQGEFSPIGPISLYTSPDYHFYPQYTEDTGAVYASRVLSYQITQRTLATTANNCVIMLLDIRNTSNIAPLTGGKLLYMVDINVATMPIDDRGGYDSTRRLVYLKDESGGQILSDGYAMGISLLEGSWRGYGVLDDNNTGFPDPILGDTRLRNELITPTNAITNGNNDVVWIVANIPDLAPDGESSLAFGLCGAYVPDLGADAAATELTTSVDDMAGSYYSSAELSVSKMAEPPAGSPVVAGEPISYWIAVSNTGCRAVGSIVVTDTLPTSTDLITYSISQGSIAVNNRLVTASVGSLSPGGVATVTLVARPAITTTDGTVISNQAYVTSNLIVTTTNVVTHRVVALVLTATKRADPWPSVAVGERLTYTIVISNGSQGAVSGVAISDTLPANTQFVAGSIGLTPPSAGIAGTIPPTLATGIAIPAGQSVTVTLAVTTSTPLTAGTIITNTAAVTRAGWVIPLTAVVTNTVRSADLAIGKSDSPDPVYTSGAVTYTLSVNNAGPNTATGITVTDELPAGVTFGSAAGSGWSCDHADLTVTCTLPSLAPATTSYITLVVTAPITGGTIANTASVSATTPDPDIGNNTATVQTTVVDLVALSTHKDSADATGPPLLPADALIYTVAVTNPALVASHTNVVISDSVPTSTTLVAGSVQSNADEVNIDGGSITARVDTLGAGQVFTLTFRVTVDLGTGGATITNQAYVASDQQPNPPQPPPTVDVVTSPAPGLALSKWAVPDSGSDDSWTQYHFLVTNTGNMPLTDLQIWDDHLSPTIGFFGGVPVLPAGEAYLVRRWWPMSADVTNVATVTARALGFPDLLSASDDAFFDAIHPLNLAFDVSVEPGVILEAQTVTYTYRLTNTGTEWMVGGTITDTQWDVITSGLELAPGAAYTHIAAQWIATSTVDVGRAWGFNLLGVEASVLDTATVTVGTLDDDTHIFYLPLMMKPH
jgi:uncharacterized repeat protein (TIGR01451 family)